MQRIFIFSLNQLNVPFWQQHISIDGPESVSIFRDPQDLIKALDQNPRLVLIDNYFHEAQFTQLVDHCNDRIQQRGLAATLIHISPRYADQPLHRRDDHLCSALSPELLGFLNSTLETAAKHAA